MSDIPAWITAGAAVVNLVAVVVLVCITNRYARETERQRKAAEHQVKAAQAAILLGIEQDIGAYETRRSCVAAVLKSALAVRQRWMIARNAPSFDPMLIIAAPPPHFGSAIAAAATISGHIVEALQRAESILTRIYDSYTNHPPYRRIDFDEMPAELTAAEIALLEAEKHLATAEQAFYEPRQHVKDWLAGEIKSS